MESMESRLLNAFHDDHYEGGFATFETESNYWSSGNDTLGLQLTEALDGILPLSPPEHKPIFESDMDHKYSLRLEEIDCGQSTCMADNWKHDSIYSHYLEENVSRNSSSPSIEIISVDPNCDFDSPISISEDEYETDEDDDCKSSGRCSRSTRTLSSSIADYESHSSDDSQFEIETQYIHEAKIKQEPCGIFQEVCDFPANADITLKLEEGEFDNSALLIEPSEANCISLEGRKSDGLSCFETGMMDMRDFDLAAFITQDDYDIAMNSRQPKTFFPKPSKYIDPSNEAPDSESEIIVDVETVENDNEMLIRKNTVITESNDLNSSFTTQIEDDPIKDPSWSPIPKNGKGQKSQKPRTRNSNKNNNPGNNRTNSVSKLKTMMAQFPLVNVHKTPVKPKTVGLGRGKNISMCSKPEVDSSSDSDECSDNQGDGNQEEATEPPIKIEAKSPQHPVKSIPKKNISQKRVLTSVPKRTIEVEIQGNRLVEVQPKDKIMSKQCTSNNIPPSETCKTENPNNNNASQIKSESNVENSIDLNRTEIQVKNESVNHTAPPPKKKLNLEEYKKRRGETILLCSESKTRTSFVASTACQPRTNQIKLEEYKKAEDVLTFPSQLIQCHQSEGNSVKTEMCQVKAEKACEIRLIKVEKQFFDPIIEAKNKVLRLQELKKAARTKLIDSTVSAKVGPITKILPLEEIVKGSNSAKLENSKAMTFNPDYEEIIIVSVGSNTEIRIPPLVRIEDFVKNKSCTSVNLLQPNTLIYDISNTLHKVKASEHVKISSNSLISSIQETVLKKATPTCLKSNVQTLPTSPNIAGSPPGQCSPKKPEMSQTDVCNASKSTQQSAVPEHGEDKIIMHLRKDRLRPKTRTISVQTDILPQFPPLELIISTMSNSDNVTSRKERTRRRRYRSRRVSCSSEEDESRSRSRSHKHLEKRRRLSSTRSRKHSYRSKSISKANSLSIEKNERNSRRRQCSLSGSECSYSSDSSTSSYSSRDSDKNSYSSKSKSRSRSRSRSNSLSRSRSRSDSRSRYHSSRPCSAKPSYQRRVSPAVEERRIVYVGRIEQETTKEDLKRKFASYGPIRQITIHYKDTGMKYGFVTYEKAQDAYTAIDNGMRDQNINMYDISFGGRRAFCQASYSDLDGAATGAMQVCSYSPVVKKPPSTGSSFEDLLNEMKKRLSGAKSASMSRVKS